jgi:large subunit ribosomal protein L5
MVTTAKLIPRMKQKYQDEVVKKMMKEYGYKNKMAVPRFQKIVINMGVGEATQDIKVLDSCAEQLALITGQKPIIKRAKKSVSSFKVRAGMPIGCCVTLRSNRLYEFYDRLVSITLPRVRDFRGLPANSFDGRGNYTLGLREQIIFPEIDYSKVDKLKGMNITIVTTAKTDEEAKRFLELMGFPFKKQ